MSDEKSRLGYAIPFVLCLSVAAPLLLHFAVTPFLIRYVSPSVFCVLFEICYWAVAFSVVIIVCYWERQPLQSIGFHRVTVKESVLAVLLGILLFILIPALAIFVERVFGSPTQTKIMALVTAVAKYPVWARVLFAARPAFVEEILYRGYCIEKVHSLTGRIWPGALLGLMIFTALHLLNGMGIGYVAGVVLPIGMILTALYVWKRNLTLNISVHFLIDFLALVLLPLLQPLF